VVNRRGETQGGNGTKVTSRGKKAVSIRNLLNLEVLKGKKKQNVGIRGIL